MKPGEINLKGIAVHRSSPVRALALTLALAASLGGCASRGDPRDPLEGFNRGVFSFNEGLDKVLLKPVAKGYDAIAPTPVRAAVGNFFENLNDVLVMANDLLQGKVQDAGSDFGRVVLNSTFGILGLFDVATPFGLEKHDEDFGQTIGRWGIGDGPYLVLPLFGPRNVRDAVGLAATTTLYPVSRVYPVDLRNSLTATRFVSDRADLLPADDAIEQASLGDKYSYIRDAYLQRRRNMIYDGHPPPLPDDDADPAPAPGPAPASAPAPAPATR